MRSPKLVRRLSAVSSIPSSLGACPATVASSGMPLHLRSAAAQWSGPMTPNGLEAVAAFAYLPNRPVPWVRSYPGQRRSTGASGGPRGRGPPRVVFLARPFRTRTLFAACEVATELLSIETITAELQALGDLSERMARLEAGADVGGVGRDLARHGDLGRFRLGSSARSLARAVRLSAGSFASMGFGLRLGLAIWICLASLKPCRAEVLWT